MNHSNASKSTSNSTNTSVCYTNYNENFSPEQNCILIVYLAISAITNVFCNTAVICAWLIRTEQAVNLTMKVVFLVSLCDLVQGFLVQPGVIAIYSGYFDMQRYCSLYIGVEMFMYLVFRVSGYLVCLLSYDRYARLKYMQR